MSISNKSIFDKIYGLDTRSLAIGRILLGIYLIFNLCIHKLYHYKEFYSPVSGLFKGDAMHLPDLAFLSFIHNISTDTGMIFYFIVLLVLLVAFTVGFFANYTGFVAALFLSALQWKFMPLRMGFDIYAEIILFLYAFLPSDVYFSMNTISKPNSTHHEYRSKWAFLFLFQIGLFYLTTAILKDGDSWMQGSAVAYALKDINLAYNQAKYLLQYPKLLQVISYSVLIFEFLIIVLIFLPFYSKKVRIFLSFSMLFLHWGIALFINVGHFQYITSIVAIVLLPNTIWDRIHIHIKRPKFLEKIDFKVPDSFIRNNSIVGYLAFIYILIGIVLSNYIFIVRYKNSLEYNSSNEEIYNQSLKPFPNLGVFRQGFQLYAPNPPLKAEALSLIGNFENDIRIDLLTHQKVANNYNHKTNLPFWDYRILLLSTLTTRYNNYFFSSLLKAWAYQNANNVAKQYKYKPLNIKIILHEFYYDENIPKRLKNDTLFLLK
jgi:hypothetical protein